MILYIDKKNLESFFEKRQEDEMVFWECLSFMKHELYLNFNFKKEELDGFDADTSRFVSRYLIGGDSQDNEGGYDFCECSDNVLVNKRKYKEVHNLRKKDLMASYLLKDESLCNSLKQINKLIVGHIGEELAVLKCLKEIGKGMSDKITDIKSWDKHCPNTPVTDIIICDNYYFKDKSEYDAGGNDLLLQIIKSSKTQKVNVVILALADKIDAKIQIKEEAETIKQRILKNNFCKEAYVTIISTRKAHARRILTNYYRFDCDSGFNLEEYGTKEDNLFRVVSNAKKEDYGMSVKLISTYQDFIGSPVACEGEKKSNFLNFKNVK